MKAIVVRQPWASLIALGHKTIETRPGPPNGPMRPEGVRGLPGCRIEQGERIAILAGASKPQEGLRLGPDVQVTEQEFLVDGGRLLDLCNEQAWPLPLGVVVATACVAAALPMEPCPPAGGDSPDVDGSAIFLGGLDGGPWMFLDGMGPFSLVQERPFGDFTSGRWGWLLGALERLAEPIPCKGRQGVFELPADVAERLS